MALHDPVITLESVTEASPNRFNCIFRLVLPDDTVGYNGIDETFNFTYRQGKAISVYIDELSFKMQEAINKYKREKAIKSSGTVTTFITTVTGRLVM